MSPLAPKRGHPLTEKALLAKMALAGEEGVITLLPQLVVLMEGGSV